MSRKIKGGFFVSKNDTKKETTAINEEKQKITDFFNGLPKIKVFIKKHYSCWWFYKEVVL